MVSATTASPARTQIASSGQRESERTASKRMRRSSVVSAVAPTRRSNDRPVGTRSGCVGPPLQAAIHTSRNAARARMPRALPEQVEHIGVLDRERPVGALRPIEQLVEATRIGIDDEQAGIGGLQPAEA